MKPTEILSQLTSTLATLGKVVLLSRPCAIKKVKEKGKTLIIMGNGPSLRQTIDRNYTTLMKHDRMAVNFAGNAPEFSILRPDHYILADPHFFQGIKKDANVKKLWENLQHVSWPMTLHVPAGKKGKIPEEVKLPEEVTVVRFNMTPGEGFGAIVNPLYRRGLAMPRPRNVMIPAIMEGIRCGYDRIYLTGADHTWMHTLYVDDENRVVSIQPHFYKDNRKELDRVANEYKGYHINDILGSMATAFRSYHLIKDYAKREGIDIVNATEGSMIDAFRRLPLSDLK